MSALGWDLPPGCTLADIDRQFGGPDPEECRFCGDTLERLSEGLLIENCCQACAQLLCVHCGIALASEDPDPGTDPVCDRCQTMQPDAERITTREAA